MSQPDFQAAFQGAVQDRITHALGRETIARIEAETLTEFLQEQLKAAGVEVERLKALVPAEPEA